MKCNDRASLVKTWLPTQYSGAPHYLDQMIYDHALTLVSSWEWKFVTSDQRLTFRFRAEVLQERNFWIKLRARTNVRSCTRSHYGACMRCRTTYYRRTTHSCRRI